MRDKIFRRCCERKVIEIFMQNNVSLLDDGNSIGTHSTTELDRIDFSFINNRDMNKMWVMNVHKL